MANECAGLQPMGMGDLGFDDTLIYKRKFRWTFSVDKICGDESRGIPETFVKLAARPNLTIDEVEINYLNGKMWIPGKGTWETITVTYYDVARAGNNPLKGLWDWLATTYDFTNPVCLKQGSSRQAYAGRARLSLYDGCGATLEEWTLTDIWPQAVNFQDLDYAAPDEMTIELTLRYSLVAYESICPPMNIDPCCFPCTA